jgi:hypothetical protein
MEGGLKVPAAKAVANAKVRSRVRATKEIIIDEVSMLSGETLACAEMICRNLSNKPTEAWGGMRIIAVGDHYQLPPVSSSDTKDWSFVHPVWEFTDFEVANLDIVMRTKDPEFLDVLGKVRVSNIDQQVKSFLESHMASKKEIREFGGARLLSRRDEVEEFNKKKLSTLKTKKHVVRTQYTAHRLILRMQRRTVWLEKS